MGVETLSTTGRTPSREPSKIESPWRIHNYSGGVAEHPSSGAPTIATVYINNPEEGSVMISSEHFKVVTGQSWLRFQHLKNSWIKERSPISSSMDATTGCKSYQAIIGLGPQAVPFILSELKNSKGAPDHWFPALAAITGENPVRPEDRGRIGAMAKAWLDWGNQNEPKLSILR